jgi:transposase-like protein
MPIKDKKFKHPTEEMKLKAVKAFQSGVSASAVGKIFGYDRGTIHRWVREFESDKKVTKDREWA